MDTPPTWVEEHRLKKVGLYYKGYVDDVDLVRQQHQAYTVSTFGIRRSRVINAQAATPNNGSDDQPTCTNGTQGKENKV